MQLKDTPFDLPTALRVGAAYDPRQAPFAGKVTFTADVIVPNDGNEKAHVGAEVRLLEELALRLGRKVNYESQSNTFGAGFRRGSLGIGYAYSQWDNELDSGHTFSLELHY
jgi:hypothetical protein